ncbi:hypothetical protein GYMLUDRAFT_49593 [Collybiopsis luxurians FD-317 M1]|uniref:Uncharacterized protein n=1 Tax=Collybiopsis luxurians FD-317 M1 TaxID=944289 RepID=A0A0D0CDM2_9AGAR|nr:hypothetical protein GYMLUDRAFT_49593 [Collybiopsis luxurians FD-317 M1]
MYHYFVYDPHIAPKVDQWRHEFTARREARRRRRGRVAVPVSAASTVEHVRSGDSTLDDDASSHPMGGRDFEMETLNRLGLTGMDLPVMGGTATSSSSAVANVDDDTVSVLQWRNGVESATMRRRKGNANSAITRSTSSSSGTAQINQQINQHPTVSSQPPFSPIMPMNMHILTDTETETETDVDTETEADESSSAAAASTTHLYRPNHPNSSSRSQPQSIPNPNARTSNPNVDNRLSSLSSFGDLNNLATPTSSNPFADPVLPRVQAQTFSAFPPPPPPASTMPLAASTSSLGSIHSPSLIPSLSLSHPVPRADIEDNVELLDYVSSTSSGMSVSTGTGTGTTGRGVSPVPSEVVSDVLSSEFSYPGSSVSGGGGGEQERERVGGELVGLSWPTTGSMTATGRTALVEESRTGDRSGRSSTSGSGFGAGAGAGTGSVGARRPLPTGYLTREQIQHLIDLSESQALAQSGSGSGLGMGQGSGSGSHPQSRLSTSASATTTTRSGAPGRVTGASGSVTGTGNGTGTAASSVYASFTSSPDPMLPSSPTASSPPRSPTMTTRSGTSSSRRYFSPFASVEHSPVVEPTLPRRMGGIVGSDSEEYDVRSVSESMSVSDIEEVEGLGYEGRGQGGVGDGVGHTGGSRTPGQGQGFGRRSGESESGSEFSFV